MDLNTFWHIFLSAPTNEINPRDWWIDSLRDIILVLVPLLFILFLVPLLVWFERRLLGFFQGRLGPNRVGPGGLLQPIADVVKLLLKEDILPAAVDKTLYFLAPIIMLIPALVTAAVIPWHPSPVWGVAAPNVDIGVLYLLLWGSLAVYGIVLAGWASNNKYSLIGAVRSSAQMISYELGTGLSVVSIVLLSGGLSLSDIVFDQSAYGWIKDAATSTPGHVVHVWGIIHQPWFGFINPWHVFQFFPMGLVATVIYVISMLAEGNRAPFDLPEGDSELVAGYHTEYSSMKFALFFMGEYANMEVLSAIAATLFFGGWTTIAPLDKLVGEYWWAGIISIGSIILKIIGGLYFFIWIRATLPRLRYDHLMKLGWKGVLPLSLVNLFCIAIGLATSYVIGLIVFCIIAGIALLVIAGLPSTRLFTRKTRRENRLLLHGEAVPYSEPIHAVTGEGSVK
jgi:NADH-quinone oxidoreductase subunit H